MGIAIACTSVLVLASAAVVAGQHASYEFGLYDDFWPAGEGSLWTSAGIDSLGPVTNVVAHLVQVNATVPYCNGTHDVLALTFSAPILHDVMPHQFKVSVCPVQSRDGPPGNGVWYLTVGCGAWVARDFDALVSPDCAVVQPADEPNERRTVLLMGRFTKTDDERITSAPQGFAVEAFSVEADGGILQDISPRGGPDDANPQEFKYFSGEPREWSWMVHTEDISGYGNGPFLADIALHNLSAPLNTAAADPNGCAALHPSATYAVRLLFASAVHERTTNGSLAPFGTDNPSAAAMFSLQIGEDRDAVSPDRVVGVADVDDDNVVDLCVEGASAEPQVEAVVINCTNVAPLSPDGFPNRKPIVADLTPIQGPAPEAAPDVSLCGELVLADCPFPARRDATNARHAVPAPAVVLAAAAGFAMSNVLCA